jgi:NADH-quinone oxidoreductase subunit N
MPPIALDPQALLQGLYSILPETLVVATAIFVLFIDLFLPEGNKRILCGASLVGIALSLFAVTAMGPEKVSGFSGAVVHDGLGAFFEIVILSACALTLLMATGYSEWEGTHKGEFYSLLLLSTSGMMFMAKGTDLMTIFLGLETLSIPIYVLVGFHRGRMSSIEGALKYFLLGAFASGFLLYGIALMYAATGTTKLGLVSRFAIRAGRGPDVPAGLTSSWVRLQGVAGAVPHVNPGRLLGRPRW